MNGYIYTLVKPNETTLYGQGYIYSQAINATSMEELLILDEESIGYFSRD